MTKGTYSMGKKNKKSHMICRRCGKRAYHVRDRACASCGFGRSARIKTVASNRKLALSKGSRKK